MDSTNASRCEISARNPWNTPIGAINWNTGFAGE